MSDISEYMDALNGKPADAQAPQGKTDLMHGLEVLGEGALRTPANLVGMVGDLIKDAPSIVAPGSPNPDASLPGMGPASKAVGESFYRAEEQYTGGKTPRPKNDLEEFINSVGQGVGGAMVAGPSAGLRAVASGAAAGLASEGVHKAGGSDLASYLAGMAAGGVPFIGHGSPEVSPIEAGSTHPEYNHLVDRVIPTLEGGGTLENPKTSPKGAFGPMQVMPDTLKDPGHGIAPWDGTVSDTVRVGREYAAALLHKYDGDTSKMLAAYNWGEGNLDHAIEKYGDHWLDHAPAETQKYVNRGMDLTYGGAGASAGMVGDSVPPMEPEDIHSAMNDEMLAQPSENNLEDVPNSDDTDRVRMALEESQKINSTLDDHLAEAHQAIDDIHEGFDPDLSEEEVANYHQGVKDILNGMDENHPSYPKAQYASQLWQQVQDSMANGKPPVDNTLPNPAVAQFMGEPKTVEAANDVGSEAPPQQPPSGGSGGSGGNIGGEGGPPNEGEDGKYADSVNLNRLAVSNAAKQLIKDQLLPPQTNIETHAENIAKAQSYIDRHGVDQILSGFHRIAPDELAPAQTAVRMLSAASKENVVNLAKDFPEANKRTPDQEAVMKNAIEMAGRATSLDNILAKQIGRSMSARRIYIGGNKGLGEILDASHISGDSLDKIVEKINQMPSQAGEIAADAMKPGWLDYVKSAYYGISLLSRLSTPIGIFASVMTSHITEGVVHALANTMTMLDEPRAMLSYQEGWAKGLKDVPTNVRKAWAQGIPTDKASLLQTHVNLPGPLGFPSKLIASTDEFFGTLGRSAKAYSNAAQRAYSEGFRGRAFSNRVEEIVNNQSPQEAKVVEEYGKFARLQDSPTPLGRFFKGAVNNKHWYISLPATVLLPFVNIADRLMMYSIRMTPGLSFTDRLTRSDFKGGITDKAIAVNRQLLGLGVASYAVSQMLAGNITGQGPVNATKKAEWMKTHQADSVKINGHWVSYERLPFSSLMSAAATATERYQETGNKDGYMKAIEGMFMGAGAGLLHSHYLEGVSNLSETLTSGSNDKVADFIGRELKSFIPGIVQQANEAVIDPTVRDTKGNPLVDNVKAGIPGLSQTLPARHDVFGDEMKYEGGASRFVNPFPTRSIPKGSAYQTLDKLSEQVPGSVVTPPSKTIRLNGENKKLSEVGYQKYQALSGHIFKQLMGQSIGELSGMSTEDKVKLVKKNLHDARAQAREQLFGASS